MPQALFQAFIRVGCLRPAVTPVLEEWPSRRGSAKGRGPTEPGLQADWQFTLVANYLGQGAVSALVRAIINATLTLKKPNGDQSGLAALAPI